MVRPERLRYILVHVSRKRQVGIEIVDQTPVKFRMIQKDYVVVLRKEKCDRIILWRDANKRGFVTHITSLSSSFPARWRHNGTVRLLLEMNTTKLFWSSPENLLRTSSHSLYTFSSLQIYQDYLINSFLTNLSLFFLNIIRY